MIRHSWSIRKRSHQVPLLRNRDRVTKVPKLRCSKSTAESIALKEILEFANEIRQDEHTVDGKVEQHFENHNGEFHSQDPVSDAEFANGKTDEDDVGDAHVENQDVELHGQGGEVEVVAKDYDDLSEFIKYSYDDDVDEEERLTGRKVSCDDDGKLHVFVSGQESYIHVGKYLDDSEAQKSVKATLIQVGLQTHLQSTLGGSFSKADSSQAVVRIAVCLSWTFWLANQALGAMFPLYGPAAVSWFHTLIIKKYKLVPQYCTHLEVARKLSASTVLNNLNAMSAGAKWLVFYSDLIESEPRDVAAFMETLKQHRRVYQKKKAESKGNFSVQSAVAERTWPAGGIEELQAICKQRGDEFMVLHGNKMLHELDKKIFREGQRLTFAHMYVFAPQGRKSGIADVKSHQYDDLKDIGHALSEEFKTRLSHKYQAILNTEEIQPWLELQHLWRARPVRNLIDKIGDAAIPDHFFLDWEGKPIGDKVGSDVTSFFRPHGLHMTTTAIRSLVETCVDQRERNGIISHAQRAAVSKVNTHSSRVTQDYYVRADIADEVRLARNALSPSQLTCADDAGRPLIAASPTHASPQLHADAHQSLHRSGMVESTRWSTFTLAEEMARNAMAAKIKWGTAHPDYGKVNVKTGKPLTRANWSSVEMRYIADWWNEFKKENPDPSRAASLFLSHIKKDKHAIPIFHEIHTLDSRRIRYGFDAAREKGYI